MDRLSKKELKVAVEKAREGDQDKILYIFKILGPFMDRMIKKLGVFPGQPCWGMGYDELMSEAFWILYTRAIPRYERRKGPFLNYAASYLKKELRKRLIKSRTAAGKQVPFAGKVDEYFEHRSYELERLEMDLSLRSIMNNLTTTEKLFLTDLLRNGKFTPLREIERRTGIDHVTLSRIRKRLVQKILAVL